VVATLLRSSWPAGYGPLCAGLVLGEIAKAETPLSKVMVPLPKFAAAKPPDEDGANFVTRIVARGDKLVGRYGWNKHQAYLAQLPTGRLNHVFEVAGIEYPARPVPEAPGSAKSLQTRKLEVVEKPGAGELETAPKKKKEIILKKKKCESRCGDKPSAMEKVLAKPFKTSRKHVFLEEQGRPSSLDVALKIADSATERVSPLFRPC
jgi:hypothetical protein